MKAQMKQIDQTDMNYKPNEPHTQKQTKKRTNQREMNHTQARHKTRDETNGT